MTAQATTTLIDPTKLAQPSTTTTQPGAVQSTAQWQGAGFNAATGTAANAGQANQANTTSVQGILGQIMSQDNPLMQMARTSAEQDMARRGLTNSTMAVDASQRALYSAALPIASQDAAAANQTSQFNAGANNQMAQFNAGNQQQMGLANMAATNQAAQFGADARNQSAAQNAQATNQMSQFNAANQQQANLANQQAANQMAQFNAANQNQSLQFNAQQQNAQSQFNASQTNEILKSNLEFANRTQLANIEASYKTLMQANQSAGELYQQSVKNITDIAGNKDMTDAAKASAINNQLNYLKIGMGVFEKLNNITGLRNILTF